MNRKGFTLTEVIVTVVLIAIIGILVVTSSLKNLKREKQKSVERINEIIESAACTYAITADECSNGCLINGYTLIYNGLIDEDLNGEDITNKKVRVSFVDGERICKLEG